ncbi:hypothetical protein DFP73DRAFT_601209 [Morchella snyderi]|nr:hypothetical protein DFP73DRAFT_601209 [Morchella snyderi]
MFREVPTFGYAAEFVRIAGAGCSLESILKRSGKKVIKAGQHINFLASAFYSGFEDCVDTDDDTAPDPVKLFLTIPYLDWESPRNGSQKTDLPGPEFSTPAPALRDSFSKKESEVFEGQSQRPSQGSSGSGPSTILTPLERQLERLTAYNLTSGQEASWKSTLSLFEYRFGFRRGFDINSIFNQGEIFDSLGMDHEAVVRSVSFLYVNQMSGGTLFVFRSENDQQCGVLVDSFGGVDDLVDALVTATERVAQLLRDELIQSFQDRISHIGLLIQSSFSEPQKRLLEVHTTTKIELTTITRVIEAQIQAFKNLNKCREVLYAGSDNGDYTIKKLIEEREIFKRCFEGFLAEIQSSQDLIMETMELAKMETIRQQLELAGSSLRMIEEIISQEATASDRFRARQEEMHERNMEDAMLAQNIARDAQEGTTLIFTIVTTIFLPLSFYTSYYGMNTSDMRSAASTQHDFWTVCGPVSVVIITIALAIGYRKQIARAARYKMSED